MQVFIAGYDSTACERFARIVKTLGYQALPSAPTTHELAEQITRKRPEVLLLSLPIAEIDTLCTQVYKQPNYRPAVIVVGSADACCAQLFALNVSAYLTPPVAKETLASCLTKVSTPNAAQMWALSHADTAKEQYFISARTHRGVQMVRLSDVYYALSDQKYVKIRHKDGSVLIDGSLRDLEQKFGEKLLRIHRNALVNIKYLDLLETVSSGQYQVRFLGIDDVLAVSRRHLPALRDKIYNR